jgi:hypothetical protein
MFQIMTDGLVFSRHETREEAETAMATVRAETLTEMQRLLDEAEESQAFADSFSIETA